MARGKRYVVVAPLVVLPDASGAQQYAYRGREITFDADPQRLKELEDIGFLEEISADEEDPAAQVPTVFTEPPAKSANLATWRAFAASDLGGMPAEEAEKALKKDLVLKYLGGDVEDDEPES